MRFFKSLIGLSIFLSVFRYSEAADLQPLTIRDFSCGLVDTYDPTAIGDGCAQDLENVDVWTGRIEKRRGTILQNATDLTGDQPVRFLHEFPDQNGNFWMIAVSSATIFKSNNAGANWSVLTSTHGVSATSDFSAVNAFGKVRLTDGATNWILFDGNAVTVSTSSPKGKLSAFYYQRIWTADVPGERSTLRASRINDPEDWTNDGIDDGDATSRLIRQNDGYPIRALQVFKNQLLVFKDYSIDAVTMLSDGLTARVDPVSSNKGTQHPRSVQLTENSVIFLADDGFYEYDGVSIRNISGDIDSTVGAILQGNSNSRSYSETSQTDFDAGTLDKVSASIQSGSVVLSTAQFIDTEQSQWQAGSVGSGLSTTYSSGSLVLPRNGLIDDFSDGDYTANPTWSTIRSTATLNVTVENARLRIYADNTGQGVWMPLQQSTGIWTATLADYDGTTGSNLGFNIKIGSGTPTSGAPEAGWITYQIVADGCCAVGAEHFSIALVYIGTTNTFALFPEGNPSSTFAVGRSTDGTVSFYFNDVFQGSTQVTSISYINAFAISANNVYDSATYSLYVDDVYIATGTSSGVTSSTFTSRAFSVGRNETIVGVFTATETLNSGTISYAVYSDSNTSIDVNASSTYVSSAAVTNGSSFTLGFSSYVFYSANFQRTQTNYAPTLRDVQVDIRATTGSFISQDISLGSSASSFGPFRVTESGSGITYVLYTDTDTSMTYTNASTFVSSQTITNNATPSIAINTHARVGAFFSNVTYSVTPSLDAYTVSWIEGSGKFPVASLYFDQEYIISVSTFNTSRNDTILVFDRNRRWTKYSGLAAYSMARYTQRPYFGDALGGKVYRFQVDDIYTDNNAAINSRWVSKDFDFGYPITDKTMLRYYITAQRQTGSDVVFSYGVNRGSTTSTTLNLGSVTGFFRQTIIPSSLTYQRGISHRFQFSDGDIDDPFGILSVTLFPRLETAP